MLGFPSRSLSSPLPSLLLLLSLVAAQSSSRPNPSSLSPTSPPSSPPSLNSTILSLTTTTAVVVTTTESAGRNITFTTSIPLVFNVTITPTPTSSTSTNSSSSPTVSPTPDPIRLATRVDPAFGALGALLILTGLPSAFLGHKNRWTSFFLIGFYTLSLVCLVLILRFGVLPSINPPSKAIRGLFVLACAVAGVAGGAVAIFFWKVAKYGIGAWGGLALALWIQCFRDGGLITPLGLRWLMYIACAVIGFILCTIPKLHYYILLLSTGFVGASSFMLGVDCYTTAGLKEFYLWNIGFDGLFPKFTQNGIRFPVSQTMQIELGLLGATALMGCAVQFRVLKVLQRKLREIKEEQRRQDAAAEASGAERFADLQQEKEEWEAAHPSLGKHGRHDSALTETTLLREVRDPEMGDEKHASVFTLVGRGTPRPRVTSGVSEFIAAAPPAEDIDRWAAKQSPGALPALDLGPEIEKDVPQSFISSTGAASSALRLGASKQELEDLKKKEELLSEIQEIRKSIEILKVESPGPSTLDESRRLSMTSRRTLSHELGAQSSMNHSHLRPPKASDARARVQSMELSRVSEWGTAINRPTSTPLRDEEWDAYVRERKLLQPPAGISPPIPTTPLNAISRPALVSPAIVEALHQRQRRESSLALGLQLSLQDNAAPPLSPETHKEVATESVDAAPPAPHPTHQVTPPQEAANVPVTILPPRKGVVSPTPKRPDAPRTKTFEELAERHREKMREMQAPLTQAEKNQAELDAAKSRWERAKEMEKVAVTRRQAEQVAAMSKEAKRKRKSAELFKGGRQDSYVDEEIEGRQHTRSASLNAGVLASVPGASTSARRMSALKVDSWQRQQLLEEADTERKPSKRRSEVPFPDSAPLRSGRHAPRASSGSPRDPTR